MVRPSGLGGEYAMPDNVAKLDGLQLGDLQMKIGGWETWLLLALGREETQLGALEEAFDLALGVRMHSLARAYEKHRPTKDTLRALAIDDDEQLKKAHELLTRKKLLVQRLKRQTEVYEKQLMRLSREQSRREVELKRL